MTVREERARWLPAIAVPGFPKASRLTSRPALALIRIYQTTLSPAIGPVCRYEPSCSHYAYEAIERYGLLRGIGLGLRRLLRCRPFGGSGFDPVP